MECRPFCTSEKAEPGITERAPNEGASEGGLGFLVKNLESKLAE